MKELVLPVTSRRLAMKKHSSIRIFGWVVLGCLLVGLAEATQVYVGVNTAGGRIEFLRAMKVTVPSWFVLAALAPAVFWTARRFPLFGGGRARNWVIHLVAAAVFGFLSLTCASWISDYLLGGIPDAPPFLTNLTRLATIYGIMQLFMYGALVGVFYAWHNGRQLRERERAAAELALRASRLESSLTNAKLEALRMQLNPHFLFNTLNTVSVLAMKGERSAVTRIVGRLSDLLRLSLDTTRQMVPLREELEFLAGYVDIEQIRFRDRLRVTHDIDPAAADAEVPSLILQPLVENAIRHGIGRTSEGGEVVVAAHRVDDRLEIEIRDTGPGFDGGSARGGAGIGLRNTRARLDELYGAAYSFSHGDAPDGGAIVRLRIPYRAAESAATADRAVAG